MFWVAILQKHSGATALTRPKQSVDYGSAHSCRAVVMFLKENNEAARFSGRALLQKQDGVSVGKQQDYRIYALTEFAEL